MLSLASEDALKNGATPGPMTEVEFWEAKCFNLESLHEQVKSKHYVQNQIIISLCRCWIKQQKTWLVS